MSFDPFLSFGNLSIDAYGVVIDMNEYQSSQTVLQIDSN